MIKDRVNPAAEALRVANLHKLQNIVCGSHGRTDPRQASGLGAFVTVLLQKATDQSVLVVH